jgi:hypothetical protein
MLAVRQRGAGEGEGEKLLLKGPLLVLSETSALGRWQPTVYPNL